MAEVKKAAAKPVAVAKKVEVKAEPVKKEEVKTEAVKKAEPAKKAATAVKKAATAVKKAAPAKKAATAVKKVAAPKKAEAASVNVFVQFDDREITMAGLIERANEAYKAAGHKDAAKKVDVYVNVAEKMVYYVADDFAGSFEA